jgi:predicted nucleotidyltransferase
MSWKEHLSVLREVESYQKKVRRSRAKKIKTYYKGVQNPGPPYTKKPTRGRGSAPLGFGGALEEVEKESFEVQTGLPPTIWRDDKLIPGIRDRLLEIAENFIDGLSKDIKIRDVHLTGSLANYNWSKYSDLDLHVIVDYSKLDENEALVKSYFDSERMLWNSNHNIKIGDYEVEIYVQDASEVHFSGGIYSVLNDMWLAEPVPYEGEIDFATARKKSDDITTQVNLIGIMVNATKYVAALKSIERLKSKIRRMRKAGLQSSEREYSPENIAFKILRRDGVLKKLNDLKYNAYDTEMSIAEAENGIS